MAEKKLKEFCDILRFENRSAEDKLHDFEMALGNGNRCLGSLIRMTLAKALEENRNDQPVFADSAPQALKEIERKHELFSLAAKNHISHYCAWNFQLMELLAALCRFMAREYEEKA